MNPEVLQWYENFKKFLQENNIDFNNPYSLGKIIVTDIGPNALDELDDLGKDEKRVEVLHNMFEPAFLKKDEQGQRAKVDSNDVANYIFNNVDKELDEERIEYLYEKSKNGQLAILRDDALAPNLIYINPENGQIGILDVKHAIDKRFQRREQDKQDRLKSIEELGLKEETYDHLAQEFNSHAELMGNSWKDMAMQSLNFYSQNHSLDESIKITNKAATYGSYLFSCQVGSQNPSWYNTPDARRDLHLGSLAKAKIGSPNVSPEEIAFNNSDKGILQGKQFGDFIQKMMKKTGTSGVEALMQSGVFNENGERIQQGTAYDFLLNLAGEYKTGRDIYFNVKTDNKTSLTPFQYDSVFPPASQSKGESTYIEEMQKLKKELFATDSLISIDGKEYKDLKNAFDAFDKAIKKETYSGTNAQKTPEDRKKLLDAIEAVDKCATAYQNTHKLKSLSSRQKNRLCVITKIHSTFENAKSNKCPFMNDDTLAEKYVREQALAWRKSKNKENFENAMKILTDQEVFKKTVESVKNNPYLKTFLANPKMDLDTKLRLNKMDSNELFNTVKSAGQEMKKQHDMEVANKLKTQEKDGFVMVDM